MNTAIINKPVVAIARQDNDIYNPRLSYGTIIDRDDDFRTLFLDYLCEITEEIKQLTQPEEAQYQDIYALIDFVKYKVLDNDYYDDNYCWTIQIDDSHFLKIEVGEDMTTMMNGPRYEDMRNVRKVEITFDIESNEKREYTCEEKEFYENMFAKIREVIYAICNKMESKMESKINT